MSRSNRFRTRQRDLAIRRIADRGDRPTPPELPGFADSLRLLVERERYSLTDIGLMFGVSRERARQWVAREGFEYPPGTSATATRLAHVGSVHGYALDAAPPKSSSSLTPVPWAANDGEANFE